MPTIFLTHAPEMFDLYYGPEALSRLEALGEVRRNPTDAPLPTDRLMEAAQGCAIIVSDRMTPGRAPLFDASPDLAAFVRCAVDIRNVDVAAASANGVLVTRASPGFVDSVSELAVGMMVDLGRRVGAATAAYHAGTVPEARMGRQLAGSTVGVVGYGAIGARLAELGKALRMRVLVSDPYKTVDEPGVTQVAFETLLAESDFVVCLAVATEATENLIDDAAFRRMKPGACFVNVSRGNLVDESALEAALAEGRIAGAAMDVGRAPDQMPSPRLARLPNVIATPHIGGLTPPAVAHQAFETVEQVRAILAGKVPEGAVNADRANRLGRLGA